MIPCPYTPNGQITYKVKGDVPREYCPNTGEPIFDYDEKVIPVWLELNIRGDARVWDRDESSEYMMMNLVGRAFVNLPHDLTLLKVVQVKLFTSIEGVTEFEAQVFPRGTTAMSFPTLLLGDPIRVVGKAKVPGSADDSYGHQGVRGVTSQ